MTIKEIKEIKEKGLLLFECVSGSRAYGLDTAASDTDIKGVFYLPEEQFYGLDYVAQVNSESNDEVYYELGRFVELLIKNNPNILELLATPKESILFKHPIMNNLSIEMFLSKQIKDTFAGYAMTQVRKAKGLKKKILNPLPIARKDVMDFCFIVQGYTTVALKNWLKQENYNQEQCGLIKLPHLKGMYALFYDHDQSFQYSGIVRNDQSNEVCLSSVPKNENEKAYLFFNFDAYSSYCKEYREYWEWVEKRNEERYKTNQQHKGGYDSKNMMHTIRLLQMAEEALVTGRLNVKRENREELLAIKSGAKAYEELLTIAESYINRIECFYRASCLKDQPDEKLAKEILVNMRKELYAE